MARNFHRRQPLGSMSEINVTPLMDLCCSLLIIFMISAPLLQQSIDVNVPVESARPQQADRKEPIVLAINPQGQFYWGTEAVSDDMMAARLADAAKVEEPPVVQIRADAQLAYQRIVDLLDLIKGAGLSKISLETRGR